KVFTHVHSLDQGLLWKDLCSTPDFSDPSAPNRQCNMIHNIMSGGDHDNSEKPAGDPCPGSMSDIQKFAVTPVIITATDPDPTKYNAMGLNSDIMANFTEWALFWDIHTPGFRGQGFTGGARSIGLASYPA